MSGDNTNKFTKNKTWSIFGRHVGISNIQNISDKNAKLNWGFRIMPLSNQLITAV
jgi:hypothetical protein